LGDVVWVQLYDEIVVVVAELFIKVAKVAFFRLPAAGPIGLVISRIVLAGRKLNTVISAPFDGFVGRIFVGEPNVVRNPFLF
jgi:hypothetical protein